MSYQSEYNRSMQDPEGFWGDQASGFRGINFRNRYSKKMPTASATGSPTAR